MLLLPKLFSHEQKRTAWEYYEPITLHDSSLSFGTHAQFAATLGIADRAYEYFVKCVRYDLDDVMEKTGREGLHMASMVSAYQAIFSGFAGISMENGIVNSNPVLPPSWRSLKFSVYYKKNRYRISIVREGEKLEAHIIRCD
jgi:trehalose/maltose hydrolase-like predicted phosphorylase